MLWAGVSMHTKTQIVPIKGNFYLMRYEDDVILLVLVPHIRANRSLISAQDNQLCHAARCTQAALTANNMDTPMACKKYGFKSD